MTKSAGNILEAPIPSMIRAVVLDFDGVIVDSNDLKQRTFFELFPQTQEVTTLITGVLAENRPGTRFDILRAILTGLGKAVEDVESQIFSFAAEYNARIQRGMLDLGVRRDVRKTLMALSERYHLYINSGTYAPALLETVTNLGLTGYFNGIYGRPPSKTKNLAAILVTEKAIGPEVVVLGDGEEDYESAVALDCRFIGISNGLRHWQAGGCPLIPSVTDAPKLIATLDV